MSASATLPVSIPNLNSRGFGAIQIAKRLILPMEGRLTTTIRRGLTVDDEEQNGFSAKNRSYVTTLVFAALLVFGPVEPYGMVVRTVSLIAVPGAVWLILRYLGSRWDLDAIVNDRINRAITASIAGMFAVASYQAFTAKYHRECTRSVRDGDGSECIGEWIAVAGPDQAQG